MSKMTTTKENLIDLLVDSSNTISQASLGLLLLQCNSFPSSSIHIRKKQYTNFRTCVIRLRGVYISLPEAIGAFISSTLQYSEIVYNQVLLVVAPYL